MLSDAGMLQFKELTAGRRGYLSWQSRISHASGSMLREMITFNHSSFGYIHATHFGTKWGRLLFPIFNVPQKKSFEVFWTGRALVPGDSGIEL